MNQSRLTLLGVVLKTIVAHTITYVIMGLLASTILDYAAFLCGVQPQRHDAADE